MATASLESLALALEATLEGTECIITNFVVCMLYSITIPCQS